jgi:hypothetical protein
LFFQLPIGNSSISLAKKFPIRGEAFSECLEEVGHVRRYPYLFWFSRGKLLRKRDARLKFSGQAPKYSWEGRKIMILGV